MDATVFTKTEGIVIIAAYALFAAVLTVLAYRRDKTKSGFLLAGRRVPGSVGPLTIAATWIWSPALFVSAQLMYEGGWTKFIYWAVPNIVCLAAFAWFANRIRHRHPHGFTLSGTMRQEYSPRVQSLYGFQLLGLSVCVFAVQLLAGGLVISSLTGLSFTTVTILMSLVPLISSFISGFRVSVLSDATKMVTIAGGGIILAVWVLIENGGQVTFQGFQGQHAPLFSDAGWLLFWSFGLPTALAVFSGPFGDQAFYQRAFAIEKRRVMRSFVLASGLFAIAPLTFMLLGAAAAGAGLQVENTQLTNLAAIQEWLPTWVLFPFLWIVLSALLSTLDSVLMAVGSIIGHDVYEQTNPADKTKVVLPGGTSSTQQVVEAHEKALELDETVPRPGLIWWSRMAMFPVAVAALLIANIDGIQIVYLAIFYGTLRLSTMVPTMVTLATDRVLTERGVFYSIAAAILVAMPASAYGNLSDPVQPKWILAGSLLAVGISGIGSYVLSRVSPGHARTAALDRA